MSSVARKVQTVLGLSSADEIDQAVERKTVAALRPGAQAPTNLGESVIHAAADVALDRLDTLLAVSPIVRDAYLSGPDGAALRNCLRRYSMHALAASTESDK
jgi:hypothetical protein